MGGGGVCIQAKTGRCRGYFGSWGHVLVAVAVVERWPLQRGLSKSQRPRLRIFKVSVAIVEHSTWESTEINPTLTFRKSSSFYAFFAGKFCHLVKFSYGLSRTPT